MMSYFQSLLPGRIPANISNDDALRIWQDRFLQFFLFISAAIGLLICAISYSQAARTGNWTFFISGSLLFSILLTLALLRKVSYWTRSILALITIFTCTNLIFSAYGWGVLSLVLLGGFSFLSSLLLYQKSVKIGAAISLATLVFWAILTLTNPEQSMSASITIRSTIYDFLVVLVVGIVLNSAVFGIKRILVEKQDEIKGNQQELKSLEGELVKQEDALSKRLIQIKTAAEISQKLTSIIDPKTLVQQVADLLKESFDLYYVGVFLVDKTKEYAVLEYGTGDVGKRMLAAKHRLTVGGYSMIGWTTQTRKARVALDTGKDAVHFDNPFLPETRSELALPIISGINLLGALSIQSSQENAFDENDVLIFQSIADNLGVALENANSFEKSRSAFNEIRTLNRAYVQANWWNTLAQREEISTNFEDETSRNPDVKLEKFHLPLRIRGEVIGHFDFEVDEGSMDQDKLDFLDAIASQTSIALENAQLLSETQRTALQEQKINELTTQFSKATTIEEIIKSAVNEFGRLPSVRQASISLIQPEESTMGIVSEREVL